MAAGYRHEVQAWIDLIDSLYCVVEESRPHSYKYTASKQSHSSPGFLACLFFSTFLKIQLELNIKKNDNTFFFSDPFPSEYV